jgi:hypothetical protein
MWYVSENPICYFKCNCRRRVVGDSFAAPYYVDGIGPSMGHTIFKTKKEAIEQCIFLSANLLTMYDKLHKKFLNELNGLI